LVDDLSAARPVWKSEAWVPTSYGNAADMRYADRGGYVAPGGGSSSPVVAGGVVYQYFYRPSPAAPFAPVTFANRSIDDRRADATALFARAVERAWYLDLFRECADDVVVAIDAATGRTRWTAVMPQRSPNIQTHKMRGLFPVPLVRGDVLYAAGAGGRLYALDAIAGRLIWEFPDAAPAAATPAAGPQDAADAGTPSPVLAGGVLIHATRAALFGIDPATGRQLWAHKSLAGVVHKWSVAAAAAAAAAVPRDYLVVTSVDRRPNPRTRKNDDVTVVRLLDPATGAVAWTADTEFRHASHLPLIEGDLLLGYDFGQWNANAVSGGRALAYRLRPDALAKAWEAPLPPGTDSYGLTCTAAGRVFVSAEHETICLDLATGRKVATVAGPGGARTQLAFAAGDRVFLQPEGRHGKLAFLMIDAAAPDGPRHLPAADRGATDRAAWPGEWSPPVVHTTAYANQPISFPIVDGRLFVRGGDAIYCYDLRKP
jgi:outer membrane protein assembly factor BamB